MERFKIKDTPSLVVYKSTENKPIPYKGDMKFKPIFEFLMCIVKLLSLEVVLVKILLLQKFG